MILSAAQYRRDLRAGKISMDDSGRIFLNLRRSDTGELVEVLIDRVEYDEAEINRLRLDKDPKQ